ncbi:ABC transporter permease [Mucilaginibacter galii]|uniref:ABC transporter permease n=2 Tax=Mucilaginibacter galii TaxID=2005073 RepID=A0A917JC77_9SPHI|nr:ABC transporter permease [Mucilaginibacter galii]GGI51416.1 ABC transporter permease [Mucilaginibacter galii]
MFGLILGFTVFIFIAEYVAYEWNANRFHQNFNQLSRLSFLYKTGESNYYLPPGLGPTLKSNVPGIKQVVRIGENVGSGVLSINTGASKNVFREERVSFVDGQFLKVFTFPVLQGNGLLNEPQTMALSKTTAIKYFGNVNAVGKVIQVNNQFGNTDYTVTSVYQDMPQNSDIQADVLLSYKTLESAALRNGNDWADPTGLGSEYSYLYILTNENANLSQISAQATNLWHKLKPDSKNDHVGLQPFQNLHIAPGFSYQFQTYGSLLLLIAFLSVAMLIIVIAWVNYINLSTAQALNRAREVGVRKVLGASRGQLTLQYLTETFVLTTISLGVAMLMVLMLQAAYNSFLEKQLSLAVLNAGWFWLGGATLIISGTLLAGGYVSWVLSSFNPLKTIRSKAFLKVGGLSLRRGLVVFQFVTSIIFIIATIVLYEQLQYMQNQDLGMKVEQRLAVTGPSIINSSQRDNSIAFENEVRQLPFVKQLSASNNIPGQGYNFSTAGITKSNANPGDDKKSYAMLIVDDQFFKTYDINIKYGTGFTLPMLAHGWTKTKKVVLNEAAVRQLGYNDNNAIIGQKIKWNNDFEIVGVVKDYHHLGLHEQIKPMIFLPAVADGFFTLKMETANMSTKMEQIRSLYQKNFPGEPFSYSFLDEVYDKQYKTEYQLGKIFIAAAFTAVLIACMGLLGLAMFAARRRIKEIGIRKILGANVFSLVNLISADFLKLVVVALVVASPIAWYIMHRWLEGFAYRITMQWWMFASAGLMALFIAFATVSIQAIKAAVSNPVKSLRSE